MSSPKDADAPDERAPGTPFDADLADDGTGKAGVTGDDADAAPEAADEPEAANAPEAAGDATNDDADFPARLAALRELLRDPPQDDTVAERYNELLEAARGDVGRLEAIRWLGEQLRAMQDRGELPRTMIARAPRRPRPGSS